MRISKRRASIGVTLGLITLAGGLLVWTFAYAGWQEAWSALRALHFWQIALLLSLNLGIVALFSARWWYLLRLQGFKVPFLSAVVYRLAGFGVSYLTPGPQFGGEGWLLVLLRRRHAVPLTEGGASVALDKLIEILSNFSFLGLGLLISLWLGIAHPALSAAMMLPMIGLLGVLFLLFAALAGGILPASWLVKRLKFGLSAIGRLLHLVAQAEQRSAGLIRQHLAQVIALYLYSLGIWVAMVGEYWLTLHFLGANANLSQTLFSLTAARLAFLTPLPGGLGALEASQVAALQILGLGASLGLSLSLLHRARDLFLAFLGVFLGSLMHLRPRSRVPERPALDTRSVYPSRLPEEYDS
ncbi:MAG: lysylphosphatidylglycerol synthase transmembrane domain-containing protein [Anaerolineales bacterium]|nr:flippase-like domain-containing protein [Anaerolineales bacterium]MCS7248190.1 flippase-like domain-containing protein [Anaerolineales bacterium]MDW8162003.1 lysylphosphatidylglycerol synthase transmembrane domain-containing protein [Anaerolineales bacterium]MDW8446164.1 lysylphosphatidylglycerol synthase transmembrane domain-containing protein [Anaerolineales bacterium]